MLAYIRQYFRIRRDIWQRLHQVHPHPVSRQIQYQLLKRPNIPIISLTILWGGAVFGMLIALYSQWGIRVISFLPLLFMMWSSIYLIPWLYRIFEIIKKQYSSNIINTLGVIPEGKTFVILATCHAVMNRADQLHWLRITRLIICMMVFCSLLMSVSIVFLQLPSVDIFSLIRIFVDLFLLIAMLWLEHQQSVLIVYYLPIFFTEKLSSVGEAITVSISSFFLIQFLAGIVPLLVMIISRSILFEEMFWSVTLFLYICVHELILFIFFRFDDTEYDVGIIS